MVDLLKALPFLTIEDYYWRYSSAMIQIMSMDYSHTRHLSEKQIAKRKQKREIQELLKNRDTLKTDLGNNVIF